MLLNNKSKNEAKKKLEKARDETKSTVYLNLADTAKSLFRGKFRAVNLFSLF